MEVVGVVLAGVSLLATAAENYEALYQLFSTYRHHDKEVDQFTTLLGVERSKFQSKCDSLLFEIQQDSAVDRQSSAVVSSDGLVELLGSSYEACESILKLINGTLEDLTRETKGFYYPLPQVSFTKAIRKICTCKSPPAAHRIPLYPRLTPVFRSGLGQEDVLVPLFADDEDKLYKSSIA